MIDGANAGAARLVWDVPALLLAVGDALQLRFGALRVKGELSGLTRASSGHCYFALKDLAGGPALLRCAMFRRSASLLDFDLRDGLQVEASGRLAVYEPRGDLQFIAESVQRIGAGALYEEFLRLRARLQADGLFDAARKRAIEPWPRTIGIVTSTAAAALRDVLAALARRAPQVRVVVYPSPVQGSEAVPGLVAALQTAARRREVDTLLLVRGGGSLEDLWSFNDERVVRAIVASPIPVICGVGHESDVTLADLAADLRAATPTAAAELAAPARAEALAQLESQQRALQRRLRHVLESQAQRIDLLAQRLGAPARAAAQQRLLLDTQAQRLTQALRRAASLAAREQAQLASRMLRGLRGALSLRTQAVRGAGEWLAALDPQRVLARGFVWLADADGHPVQRVAAVQAGDRLDARFVDGHAQIEVLRTASDVGGY